MKQYESTWDKAQPVAGPTPIRPPTRGGFKSTAERIVAERERRLELGKNVLTLGVKFLDDALGGIFPNDLIILGAKTGRGKTALATSIALKNAYRGKRVHYFALEAEEDEIERRMKFSLLGHIVRDHCRKTLDYTSLNALNYLDWYTGKCDSFTRNFEAVVDGQIASRYSTLKTFYRSSDFYAEHFESLVKQIHGDTDLIVLDHLHYVDSDDANENSGYKRIVKKIRDTALEAGKPVLVIAHLRKSSTRSAEPVPGIEDFHGTSDVPKIATKAIIIAPAPMPEGGDPNFCSTYLAPVKCRADGSRTRYVGKCMFDVRLNQYADEFELGQVEGVEYQPVEEQYKPRWAK